MNADGSPRCRHGIKAGNYCAKCGKGEQECERLRAERDSARRERDEAQLALCRIHTWAGRALAATPDIDLGEHGKAILEDVYAEASEQVELGESKP